MVPLAEVKREKETPGTRVCRRVAGTPLRASEDIGKEAHHFARTDAGHKTTSAKSGGHHSKRTGDEEASSGWEASPPAAVV